MPARVHAPAAERLLDADDDHAGVHQGGLQRAVRADRGGAARGHSKIRLGSDGVGFFLILLKVITIFSPLRIFVPISVAAFAARRGLRRRGRSRTQSHVTNSSVLLILMSVVIFLVGLVSEQISSLRFEGRAP